MWAHFTRESEFCLGIMLFTIYRSNLESIRKSLEAYFYLVFGGLVDKRNRLVRDFIFDLDNRRIKSLVLVLAQLQNHFAIQGGVIAEKFYLVKVEP